MRFVRLAAALAALLAAPAAADLLLNEVLYDPEGADEGAEFVELWNPDDEGWPLQGVALEVGDGARPGAWAPAWSGSAADTVRPHAPFLISGDALAAALQNGPDALRLRRGDTVLDLLGYGALEAAALYEGAPAPDAASGQSLARREDGGDTGVNRDDWAAEIMPTPGRANHPEIALSFLPRGLTLEPAVPWPAERVRAAALVRNRGRRALQAYEWSLKLERLGTVPGPSGASPEAAGGDSTAILPIAASGGRALAPGESAAVAMEFDAPAARGLLALRARLEAGGGAAGAAVDTAFAATRIGGGPAIVGEFAFRGPAGEWVEIELTDSLADLGRLRLADRSGSGIPVERGPAARPASPGARYVLAESPATLRARFALPESVTLALRGAWPALNDADADDGRADVIRVLLDDGTPCDAVGYARGYGERGGSVERLSPELPSAARGTWAESIDPLGGTPGRPNSLRAAPGGPGPRGALLAVSARRVRRGADGALEPAVLRLTGEAVGRRLRIEVRDLLGRPRRLLAEGQRFPAGAAFTWDGRDDRGEAVPPGVYTVRAQADAEPGLPARGTSLALTVAAERAR